MWQRKQTLFFGIALVLVAIPLLGLSFFTYSVENIDYTITAFGIENSLKPTLDSKLFYLPILLTLVTFIGVIISFKNRKRQLSLGWLSLLLVVFTAVFITVSSLSLSKGLQAGIGLYLHIAAILFILLGILGIRKDKKLIDSLNRLR